jgi:hypothetical protein
MDAFAITGVSPEHEWFRVQAAVGGVASPARLFPRIHIVRSGDIADLATGGRRIYFQQAGPEHPLVPLASEDATSFDPHQVPLEEIPQFAFTESATDYDVEALLLIANGDVLNGNVLDLMDRLEGLGWVSVDAGGAVKLTPIGYELLRHRVA